MLSREWDIRSVSSSVWRSRRGRIRLDIPETGVMAADPAGMGRTSPTPTPIRTVSTGRRITGVPPNPIQVARAKSKPPLSPSPNVVINGTYPWIKDPIPILHPRLHALDSERKPSMNSFSSSSSRRSSTHRPLLPPAPRSSWRREMPRGASSIPKGSWGA